MSSDLISSKQWIIDKYIHDLDIPFKDSLEKLVIVSDYASKNIKLILEVIASYSYGVLQRRDYFSAVKELNLDWPILQFSTEIRLFRHKHLLRLLWLELAGVISTEQAIKSWSDCADAIILHALEYCHKTLVTRYGHPKDLEGKEVRLYTLAMGKLGGLELNYSSDIDLIFAFTSAGDTHGGESIDNQQFFIKVIQQFVQLLQNSTAQGFAFRVDLRLRPNGDSGSLVLSLPAMETYYQEQGRDWERYAMVKARVIDESPNKKFLWFEQLITPFVYKRYVDFSVIESLRSMKAMIEKEVQLNPRLNDIKRGQGGIREVEFIIQSMQLIRGGRLLQLRHQNALVALLALKQELLLPRCEALRQAYLFLRRLENVIQTLNDQQTHALPESEIKQEQVTLAMGFISWQELVNKLHQYKRIVSNSFRMILGKPDDYANQERLLAYQLNSVWHGHVETDMAINLLTSLGFVNAEQCYQMLHTFKHGSRCRRLSQAARMRLDRFMVLLLNELTKESQTDSVLLQVIHLLENIVGRSAYLALLTENPQTLNELLFWFSNSPYITSLLVNHPFLLEVLLEQHQNWRPATRKELEHQLSNWLIHLDEMEAKEEVLRQFKLTQWLMAARAELFKSCSAVRIGRFLADSAEVIVRQVFHLAFQQLIIRYPEMKPLESKFAIIAYGKLGSREMNYTSDLDLVFLHTAKPSEEPLVTRLTQKIMHMLTTRSQAGVLFTVDTRLRPSGSSGLLVSHLDAFMAYQKQQAWTWEHQALLKARVIVGSPLIKKKFLVLKKEVLLIPRDKQLLQKDVLDMRTKMSHFQKADEVKNSPGGLIDLEFFIQYLVLNLGDPQGGRYTHALSQLKQLYLADILSKEQYLLLKKAYRTYHHGLHQQVVCSNVLKNSKLHERMSALIKSFMGIG